jgi:pimeloyl-ACP methyl ester carboxylesterase
MKSWPAGVALLAVSLTACASQPEPMPAAFDNAGARLAFTLDLPEGRGPFPAVVLGHGSGRVTRDQLRFAAARFTSFGFAVLRFDKRGVGESTGQFVFVGTRDSPTVFPQLASDIEAGVRFLRTRPEIDPRRIGISGWSQAGWILPIVAHDLGDVAFMVIMSGPVCSVGLEMYYSEFAEGTATPLDLVYPKMRDFNGPSGFDVVPTLEAIDTPGLWLFGSDDRSIPERDSLTNLKTMAASGKPFEWREYPALDHPLSPDIWGDVERWISKFKS